MQDIISVDPCHKFTWCLDACIREKNVDVKRSRELQGFLDSIKVEKRAFVHCVISFVILGKGNNSQFYIEGTGAGVGRPEYDFV